jgi:hypothetical protein
MKVWEIRFSAAISPDAIDAVMPSLVTLETPLLVETPFSWKVQTGWRLLKSVKTLQLAVGVAEQTPYLPLEQLKRRLIELGFVGRVVAAINDFAVYDYHGIAALRAYIGSYRDAVRANAVQSRFPWTSIPPDHRSKREANGGCKERCCIMTAPCWCTITAANISISPSAHREV